MVTRNHNAHLPRYCEWMSTAIKKAEDGLTVLLAS